MPRSVSTPEACINKYVTASRKSSKIETYEQYKTVLTKITKDLRDNGYNPSPYVINEKTIRFLLDVQWKDMEVSTRKWNTHILSRYLRFFDNYTLRDMDIRWPHDMRPTVDWLTDDEQAKLLMTPMTTLERTVIHLELNIGLRIAEVCNLRVENINYRLQIFEVLGKGSGEGKWRSVPFNKGTTKILEKWMEERNSIAARTKEHNPLWVDPGNLLLWCHYKDKPQAGAYSDRGHSLDRAVIHKVRDRADLQFTNHTLRRTFGRTSYHAGATIESISKLLGHEDLITTLKYLGINMDDMKTAITLHGEYQEKILKRIQQEGGVQSD